MAAKIEIYNDAAGKFRFRFKSGNGQVVAASQAYATKAAARKGINAVATATRSGVIIDLT